MANERLADMVKKRRKILVKKQGIEEEMISQARSNKESEELVSALQCDDMEKAKAVLTRIASHAPTDYVTRLSVQDATSKKVLCRVGSAVVAMKPGIMQFTLQSNGDRILKVEASPAAGAESSFSVVWLGLEASGKSSLIERIRQDEFVSTSPTIGLNVTSSVFEGAKIVNCDVSGHKSFRSIWDSLIVGHPDVVVYVIDGSEPSSLDEVKRVITDYVLKTEVLKGIPLLFMLNKQDVEGAVKEEELMKKLCLTKLVQDREWKLLQASAKTGQGILEMLEWILEQINSKKGLVS
jgi:small GTP-binding protein